MVFCLPPLFSQPEEEKNKEQPIPTLSETKKETPPPPDTSSITNWANGSVPTVEGDFLIGNKTYLGIYLDSYYTYSFNNPRDNTLTGSSTEGRVNEFQVNLLSFGIDKTSEKARARFFFQSGAMMNLVQDTDTSVDHGANVNVSDFRYIREGLIGYVFFGDAFGDVGSLTIDAGVLPSMIGVDNYLNHYNWNYQRSPLSDFTPFYFTGIRGHYQISKEWAIEPLLLNGWQSYAKFNSGFSVAFSLLYSHPSGNFYGTFNSYAGTDTAGYEGLNRYHEELILQYKYFSNPSTWIGNAAFSSDTHYGFQTGDGISPNKSYVFGSSFINRIWFKDPTWAFSSRVCWFTNPSSYLIPAPLPGKTFPSNSPYFFDMTDWAFTIEKQIIHNLTFKVEYIYRASNTPLFSKGQGSTAYDLATNESRLSTILSYAF